MRYNEQRPAPQRISITNPTIWLDRIDGVVNLQFSSGEGGENGKRKSDTERPKKSKKSCREANKRKDRSPEKPTS